MPETTDIPSLPELVAAEITSDLTLVGYLGSLPSDRSRRFTKSSFLSSISSQAILTVAATITGTLTLQGSLAFTGGATISNIMLGSGDLSFGNIAAGASEVLTVSVPGCAVGDFVNLNFSTPPAVGLSSDAWVSADDVVSVRLSNLVGSAISGATYAARVVVIKGA